MSRNFIGRFIGPDQLVIIRRQLKTQLEGIVRTAVSGNGPLVVRDLVPSDYGVGAVPGAAILGQYTNVALGVVNTYVASVAANAQMPNNMAIGIYGIADLAAVPTLMESRFTLGAAQLMAQVRLSPAYASNVNIVYIDPPVVYKPLETVNWTQLFNAATAIGAEAIDLIGLVCEPSGRTVTVMSDR